MRHATWVAIDSSPVASRAYAQFRRLPTWARSFARWIAMPRWQIATALIRTISGGVVVDGPFKGLKLHLSPISSRHLLGYILGTQELELHGVTEEIISRSYAKLINVGAADGYYAVGLAMRSPTTRVAAFEALPDLHPVLAQVAASNGVADRLTIGGLCTQPDLAREIDSESGRTLVVCDIEGGEVELLDPAAIPGLAHVDILIETHDCFVPGATETLLARFGETHAVKRIEPRPRTFSDFPQHALPVFAEMMPKTAVELMHERRTGNQNWLFLTSRNPRGASS